jgi:hypothetical protein
MIPALIQFTSLAREDSATCPAPTLVQGKGNAGCDQGPRKDRIQVRARVIAEVQANVARSTYVRNLHNRLSLLACLGL